MSRLGYTLFFASLLGSSAAAQNVDSLLAQMTFEEKLGQMHLPTLNNSISAQQLALVRRGLVGGFLNLLGTAQARDAQRISVTESRLKIPLLLGYDVIHGYRPIFTIPLATARRCDPET